MEKCDEVIFMNSVMRPILINKEEFYLAYTHGDINISEISKYLENQNEEQSMMKKNSVSDLHNLDKNKSKAFDLGRIELFPKNVSQGSYYKYSSDQGFFFFNIYYICSKKTKQDQNNLNIKYYILK